MRVLLSKRLCRLTAASLFLYAALPMTQLFASQSCDPFGYGGNATYEGDGHNTNPTSGQTGVARTLNATGYSSGWVNITTDLVQLTSWSLLSVNVVNGGTELASAGNTVSNSLETVGNFSISPQPTCWYSVTGLAANYTYHSKVSAALNGPSNSGCSTSSTYEDISWTTGP